MSERTLRPQRQYRIRAACILLAIVAAVPVAGGAHGEAHNAFTDTFPTLGPLQGSNATHAYEIRGNGRWRVEEQIDLTSGTSNRVLVQSSYEPIATPDVPAPLEPLVFVREREFRSVTAQVTMAFMDNDTTPNQSAGLVFRAPVFDDGTTDVNNMYFFGAAVVGISRDFPTGKVYALFKRFGKGWYMLNGVDAEGRERVADTWANFTVPHTYKVIATHGNIQAFVDGRLVIQHSDVASGDNPTTADPMPGLPYDMGTVGLRTVRTRAWFDNFSVVGNDGYEGRAQVADLFVSGGQGGETRRGGTAHVSGMLTGSPANKIDTGTQYHDHDFDSAVARPLETPGSQGGANVRTFAKDGVVTSISRITGIDTTLTDPDQKTTVRVTADALEVRVSASCEATSSSVHLVNGVYHIKADGPDGKTTEVGPAPIKHSASPNTVLFEHNGVNVRLSAHTLRRTTAPQRAEATGLLIEMFEGPLGTPEVRVQQVPGGRLPAQQISSYPAVELSIGNVVAGRYCP